MIALTTIINLFALAASLWLGFYIITVAKSLAEMEQRARNSQGLA